MRGAQEGGKIEKIIVFFEQHTHVLLKSLTQKSSRGLETTSGAKRLSVVLLLSLFLYAQAGASALALGGQRPFAELTERAKSIDGGANGANEGEISLDTVSYPLPASGTPPTLEGEFRLDSTAVESLAVDSVAVGSLSVDSVAVDSLMADSVLTDSTGLAATSPNLGEELKKPVFVIKNNLLYDAVLTPNLTFEVKLAERWTLQTEVGFNPFPLDDTKEHKWRHLLVGLEAKYWFDRAFRCDFIGVNAYYSHFNVAKGAYPVGWLYPEVKNYRLQGDAVMAGVSYGWFFNLSKHVAIELEAGVDGGYAWYDRFNCPHCGALIDSPRKWFAVPKAGVNIAIVLPNTDDDDCPCRHRQETEFVNEEFVNEELHAESGLTVDSIGPISPISLISPISEPAQEPVVEPVLSAPERLNSPILHAYSEYKPYSPDIAVSRDSDALYVYFEKDSSVIDRRFGENGLILDSIVYLVGELMKDSLSEMKLIQIVGFASFDGPLKKNDILAQNRAQALKDYVQAHVDVPDSLFEVNNGGEAWAELEWAVEQSDYKLKDKVLRIIREEPNPNKREVKLKELDHGWAYVYLKESLLMKFRNSGYIRVYWDKPENGQLKMENGE